MQGIILLQRKILFRNGLGIQEEKRSVQEAIQAVNTFEKAPADVQVSQKDTQHLPGQENENRSQ